MPVDAMPLHVTTVPAPAGEPARIMARSAKTFHGAARLLPQAVRRDVQVLYAFCRAVDDLADAADADPAEADRLLAQVEAELAATGGGPVSAGLGWRLLPPEDGAAPLMRAAAAALVRTVRTDLEQQQPRTVEDLQRYAFGVAGTVGLMMAALCRADRRGLHAAMCLGMAMQVTNIVRDVAADLRAGRVYLPVEWVPAAVVCRAVTERDAAAQATLRRATRRALRLADGLYAQAYAGIWALPWRTRWSILAAALCYRNIGVLVGRDVEASWRRRTVVSRMGKLRLLLQAGVWLLAPRFWRAGCTTRSGEATMAAALRRCEEQAAR